jgi:hypothetical protein
MKNKPVAVLAGILAALVGAWVAHNAFDRIRGVKGGVAPEVLTEPWSHQSLGAVADFVFDTPWTLEPTKLDLPAELLKRFTRIHTYSHEAQGLSVLASEIAMASGSPSLEGAADGAIRNVKSQPATASVEASKQPTAVGGYPAIEIEATVRQKSGDPLHLHGLVVVRGSELFQLVLIHRQDQPLGNQAWSKTRASVRLAGAA